MKQSKLWNRGDLDMNGLSAANEINESLQKPCIWPNPNMEKHNSIALM